MSQKRILIVEDEPAIREMLAMSLEQAGYEAVEAGSVEEAQQMIGNEPLVLVLLDWMLPDQSGVEFARRLKRDELTRHLPIIMLTARSEEEDKVRGLDAGADDYITKPFSNRELHARIKAVIRRSTPEAGDEVLQAGDLALDPVSHRVTAAGEEVELGPTEFRLLRFFMGYPERVFSRTQLLDRVWGGNVYVEERTVDVHIRRLRKALEPFELDNMVQTVRGTGYRFSKQV
ncbi:phosphate regulon transcriptional regulator PhoB [Endothiovibrio diazotrophicus]